MVVVADTIVRVAAAVVQSDIVPQVRLCDVPAVDVHAVPGPTDLGRVLRCRRVVRRAVEALRAEAVAVRVGLPPTSADVLIADVDFAILGRVCERGAQSGRRRETAVCEAQGRRVTRS